MKKITFVSAVLLSLFVMDSNAEELDPAIRDYGISEFVVPSLRVAFPHMNYEQAMSIADCQVSTLERMLDSSDNVRSAMSELPLYIEWSNGFIEKKPELQHENAVLNAYMQCQG